MQAILDYSRRPDGADSEWQRKAGIVTMMAVLSPDDAAAIKEKWIALVAPYIARAGAGDGSASSSPQAGQRHVRYFMAATPLPVPDSADGADGSGD